MRWLALLLGLWAGFSGVARADQTLTVLTFNVWGGGAHLGLSLADTAAVLRASRADVIGLQEADGRSTACASEACARQADSLACALARELQYYCLDQTGGPAVRGATAVLSRFPIVGVTGSGLGVRIDLGSREAVVFNLHLPDAPYQPYQLLGIAYGGAPFLGSQEDAVDAAKAARGEMMAELERDLAALEGQAVVIAGDFNEPSARDWTARAAALGRHPLPVAWPTTGRLERLGFIDAYRAAFPDELERPGFTWTVLPGAREHHDRIDFIFARGPGLEVIDAAVLGEKAPEADIVVTPWPSDHRAVRATIRFGSETLRSAGRVPR